MERNNLQNSVIDKRKKYYSYFYVKTLDTSLRFCNRTFHFPLAILQIPKCCLKKH